jgi:hypothetical protein
MTEAVFGRATGLDCWAGLMDFGQMGCGQVSALPFFLLLFFYFYFSCLLFSFLTQIC